MNVRKARALHLIQMCINWPKAVVRGSGPHAFLVFHVYYTRLIVSVKLEPLFCVSRRLAGLTSSCINSTAALKYRNIFAEGG
jgi:hypothetical protein